MMTLTTDLSARSVMGNFRSSYAVSIVWSAIMLNVEKTVLKEWFMWRDSAQAGTESVRGDFEREREKKCIA